ncbi:unnamed protein product [Ectocarpus sp. 6 AP-2014]
MWSEKVPATLTPASCLLELSTTHDPLLPTPPIAPTRAAVDLYLLHFVLGQHFQTANSNRGRTARGGLKL